MPTTQRSGLTIHYELEGTGPPLVLLHGGYTSSELWRIDGYIDGLRDDHQVVLIDLRGHGRSEKPHDPNAYRFSRLATDVVAVLDEVGLSSAAVCGFSLGANTALRMAACYPDRVDAVAAIGSDPEAVGFADLPTEGDSDDTRAQIMERDGMARLVAKLDGEGRPERARLVSQADPRAMAAWMRGWTLVEPIPERLTDLAVPALFAWGEMEIEGWTLPSLPPSARLVVVPGADHVGVLERPDLMLPALKALLAEVSVVLPTTPLES
jgi:pimeloyl-ACP methyl ester carboxylesterase